MRQIALIMFVVLIWATGCATSPRQATVKPPPAISATASVSAEQGPFQPDANLYLCPNATITNALAHDSRNRVLNFNPVVLVDGKVVITPVPVNNACMTSGFGHRSGRDHNGLDLKSSPPGTIYSAAPGIIREAKYSSGFGNYVVIDHGQGVFTRYGHMAHLARGVQSGQKIGFGQPLGVMGQTGNATGIHVHFEILTGNYNTPKRSFGLTPRNPLSFPPYTGQASGS
ncbi:M23 family metallopeptidase [Henriciella aquimarina]|uniref:M23 family metallopeptidase n=1 Tax=Henriciella aquimarina TaxID=545261 RepID=UPI000A076B0B|nr:M23 family metallopeptidase [Henriciella aquimarina]